MYYYCALRGNILYKLPNKNKRDYIYFKNINVVEYSVDLLAFCVYE